MALRAANEVFSKYKKRKKWFFFPDLLNQNQPIKRSRLSMAPAPANGPPSTAVPTTADTERYKALVLRSVVGFSGMYAATVVGLKKWTALNLHRGNTPILGASRCTSIVHASLAFVRATQLLIRRHGLVGILPFGVEKGFLYHVLTNSENTEPEAELMCWSLVRKQSKQATN